jgi:hypothetical protein
LFSTVHIAEHQRICLYGKVNCPFKISYYCHWRGLKSDIKGHAKVRHRRCFVKGSTIDSSMFVDGGLMILS